MHWLYDVDMNVFRAIHLGWQRNWLDPVFVFLTCTGLGEFQVAATLLFLIKKSTRPFVAPLLVTFVVSGLLGSQLPKHLLERDRPSLLALAHPHENIHGNSFPSGHTTCSFALATMLVLLIWNGKYRAWGLVALAWAMLVGISRIYLGVHWPTDVAAGLFSGVACAAIVWLIFDTIARRRESAKT